MQSGKARGVVREVRQAVPYQGRRQVLALVMQVQQEQRRQEFFAARGIQLFVGGIRHPRAAQAAAFAARAQLGVRPELQRHAARVLVQ